jgi:hypothetical protein
MDLPVLALCSDPGDCGRKPEGCAVLFPNTERKEFAARRESLGASMDKKHLWSKVAATLADASALLIQVAANNPGELPAVEPETR